MVLVLVAGLLRSHAEILKTLHARGSGEDVGSHNGDSQETDVVPANTDAHPIHGASLARESVELRPIDEERGLLLAFLTSGCSACRTIWRDIEAGDENGHSLGVRVVAVAKDREEESVSRLKKLAPDWLPVVLSSSAWRDYQVPSSPYFVYVVSGEIVGQGSAKTWANALEFVEDQIADVDEEEILALAREV